MLEYLTIGKIINTHGIKGEVKVLPLTDDPERFEDLDWVFLDLESVKPTKLNANKTNLHPLKDTQGKSNPDKNTINNKENNGFKKLYIENIKYFKNTVIIKFKDINTVEAAEALKNTELKIDRANAVKLPEDSYFICDLLGCNVFEEDKNLGELTDVIVTGSNDVYVVKPKTGKEILVPALKNVVLSVNINERKITVKLPEGLLDDEV